MHTNYYKIVKQLKSFKIIIFAPACFGLHKPSSGSSQPVHIGIVAAQPQYRYAQAESFLMMVYVNRNMLEQIL